MSREDAVAVAQRLMRVARQRDLPQLADCYAADAVAISPVFGEVRGRERIAATWQTLFDTFADANVEVSDVLVDGNRVAILSRLTTTDRSGWFGLPPTGGPISYPLMLLLTIADGRIVRDERIYDSAGVVERLEKVRLDQELRTAAAVQRALLPRTAYVGRFCESVGDSVPCRAIGGDFFEFVELLSGDVGIVMGDVSGKGPAAALLASMLQGMFAVEARAGHGPARTLLRMNELLTARQVEWRFATLVYAVLSPNGTLVYANAGHNPPVLLASDGIHRLTTGGPILGMFPNLTFEEQTLPLHGGDTLVMFTDGVTEARSAHDEEFGEDRLMASLTEDVSGTPIVVLNRVFAAVREFCQHTEPNDDITVTVTRFR